MPKEIACPSCKAKFHVADKYMGKRVKCAKCGNAFTTDQQEALNSLDKPSLHSDIEVDTVCPWCNSKFHVPYQTLGEQGKCPACGSAFTVAPCGSDENQAATSAPDGTPSRSSAIEGSGSLARRRSSSRKAKSTASDSHDSRSINVWYAAISAALVGLIIGYFIGREHVKYEVRAALLGVKRAVEDAFPDAGSFNPRTEDAEQKQRDNQLKQLLVAMNEYHDATGHLPASAIYSTDGAALLSWRVAILPYLFEDDLYRQFHLNEPWDSPHNRTLIEQMPSIYGDPDSRLRIKRGDTTYVVPTGPGTAFDSNNGISFSEITDGTSKTLVLVEVEPSKAVIWTQPADWQVNWQNPRGGIERTDRSHFLAGFADAHTEEIPIDVKSHNLRALLTRVGREAIETDAY